MVPRKRRRLLLVGLVIGVSLAASSVAWSASQRQKSTTLTIWTQGSLDDQNVQWLPTVAKRFEQAHPGVTVNIVSKPTANFIALVRTAIISGSGPDLVGLWPGTEINQFMSNLVNLDQYESVSKLKKVTGIQYFAKNGSIPQGTYAAPTENQFYIMYYNKKLFKKAGITSPPRSFHQAVVDGKRLKHHGILPFVYGQALGLPEFSAVFDWSYLLAGVYSLKQWNKLLNGKIPYNSPKLVKALKKWHAIYAAGLVNKNALNAPNALQQFEHGKAAMLMSYSGYIPTFQKALGAKNVGVMAPPWSSKATHVIAGMPGYGFAALSASPNAALAAALATDIISKKTQKLVAKYGQIPVVASAASAKNHLQLHLIRWDTSAKYRQYPMFDNFSQPSVTDVLVKELPAVFVGQTSAQSAMNAARNAVESLSPSDRNINYHLGK